MRMTAKQTAELRKRIEARRDRCSDINGKLDQAGSRVILSTIGAGVEFIHLDYPTEDRNSLSDYLVLQSLNDVEFDQMDLADSRAAFERAMVLHQAIQAVTPAIQRNARNEVRRDIRGVLEIEA